MSSIQTVEENNPDISHPHPVSRRGFLKSGSLLAAGLALGLPWFGGCTKSVDEAEAIWNELARELKGELLRPDYSGFARRAAPWALQYKDNVLPRAIARCMDKEDVKACILWARKHQIPIVARSGGHSYGGYSTTPGLMIDVSAMNGVLYDPATKLLRAEGGARNRQVFEAGKKYDVSITHGRCFEVGVAGLVLGGGIGFDMRMNGYTCDKLVETEVVLANGDIITCSESQNSDLFWACRGGGGGNFGIHTSFVFKTFGTGTITIFNIIWDERPEELLLASQRMIANVPDTLGLKLNVTVVKKGGVSKLQVSILGSFQGDKESLKHILAPMTTVQEPVSVSIEQKSYWEGNEIISEPGEPEYAHERSRFIKSYLTPDAIAVIVDHLRDWPGTSEQASWKFFLLGGAIDSRRPDEMAMVHRGYTMLSSIDLVWSEKDSESVVARNKAWLDRFHEQMLPHTSRHCYQNFIDPRQEDYLYAYYGRNLERLKEVKRKYDPDNIFTYPQAIPL